MNKHILSLLEEIRSIAHTGLNYSKDIYDIERYERLLKIVSQKYSQIYDISEVEITKEFKKELGYITPKVGVNGIILHEDGTVLLEKRSNDQKWGIPGGWAEVGESPQRSLVREFHEETGFDIEVKGIIDIFTQYPGDYGYPHTSYHMLFYCEVKNGILKKSHESLELGFYDYRSISDWHRDHQFMV